MKRRILVPGLGIAKAMGFGCTCNLSYGELISKPSTLLWTDKLCVPGDFASSIKEIVDSYESYAIRSLFDSLGENGMIEIVDSSTLADTGRRFKCLNDIVEREVWDLMVAIPEAVSFDEDGHMLSVGGRQYCFPMLVAGYASQLLAHEINAGCLIDRRFDRYLRFRKDVLSSSQISQGYDTAYNEIFSVVIPNDLTFPLLVYPYNTPCPQCHRFEKCDRDFKDNVKNVIQELLRLRCQDSFALLRQEIDTISSEYGLYEGHCSVDDIKKHLHERALKIYRMEQREFPRIKRWTNLAMMISAPIAYLGVQMGSAALSTVGGAGMAMAKLFDGYVDHCKSKGRWIDYLNKRTSNVKEC